MGGATRAQLALEWSDELRWDDVPHSAARCGRCCATCSDAPRATTAARRAATMSREKIQPEHLARPAFVYVRQSKMEQVRRHQESRRRQYGLAEHTRALGWREVIIIDDDQAKSGTTATNRAGFQRLVAAVGLGQAGAVVGLEVARLARNNRDWYQLLDLCGLMNTVIVDAEGIYDPRQLNDRLLLGLKGTISEAEIGWLRQRAHESLLAKARRGELILGLPVGYVRGADGRVEKDPDHVSSRRSHWGSNGSGRWGVLGRSYCGADKRG
jgi:DNA invertase Pin-like site-specific DNA recombinase